MKQRKFVTLKDLRSADACNHQVVKFKELFGSRAAITTENIRKAFLNNLDIEWLVNRSEPIEEAIPKPKNINTVIPKVGDTVTIRPDFFMCDRLLYAGSGSWASSVGLNKGMFEFAGKSSRVNEVEGSRAVSIDIDNGKWHWGIRMLEIIK